VPGASIRAWGRAALALALVIGVTQWSWWVTHRTRFIEDVKASLPRMIGDDAVLLGPTAPLLTQDTRHRVLPYFGPPGDPDVLRRYGVTHVVICGPGDAKVFEGRHPGLLDASHLVQVWPVNTLFSATLEIRRLPSAFGGQTLHAYAPSTWEEAVEAVEGERWEEALERFGRFRDEGAGEIPELLSLESVCWFKLGDLDRAETLVREAIRQRPMDPLNHQSLGVLHLRRGERSEALQELMTALRLNRDNPEVQSMITELAR
jgi:hypothetical protein